VKWVGHSLKVKHKTDRKTISSELLAHYHTEGQTYPRMLQQMKPESIILNCRQEGNPCNGTIVNIPTRKKFKKSPSVS